MAINTLLECYRFTEVDFVPEKQLIIWKNQDQHHTHLTHDENELLESLCSFAGEAISFESLYKRVYLHKHDYPDHNNYNPYVIQLLSSLSNKLSRDGVIAIPIDIVSDYGLRVPLPKTTCLRQQLFQPRFTEPHTKTIVPSKIKSTLLNRIFAMEVWQKMLLIFISSTLLGLLVFITF